MKTRLDSMQEIQIKMNSQQKPQMKTGLMNILRNIHILMKKEFFTEISSRKRAKANLTSECRELLQRLKNATFDVEERSEVFVELKQSLTKMPQKLYSAKK